MLKKPSEMNREEWEAFKKAQAEGKAEETLEEPKEPEKAPEEPKEPEQPKPEEDPAKEPEKEPAKEPEPKVEAEPEDVDIPDTVPLSKYMSEKNKAKEQARLVEELTQRNKELEGKLPKSEREAMVKAELTQFATETGANPDALEKMMGIMRKAMSPDIEAVEAFNREQADKRTRAEAEVQKTERERRLGKEFEGKEFRAFLDERGITKPEDIQAVKKTVLSDALILPDGVPLKRVYLSSDAVKYELSDTSAKKAGEQGKGGDVKPAQQKAVKDMNHAEFTEYKNQQQSLYREPIKVLTADGKVKIYQS